MFSHYWSFRMYDYPVSCGLYVRKYSWAFSFSYTDLICKHIYYPPPPPPPPIPLPLVIRPSHLNLCLALSTDNLTFRIQEQGVHAGVLSVS